MKFKLKSMVVALILILIFVNATFGQDSREDLLKHASMNEDFSEAQSLEFQRLVDTLNLGTSIHYYRVKNLDGIEADKFKDLVFFYTSNAWESGTVDAAGTFKSQAVWVESMADGDVWIKRVLEFYSEDEISEIETLMDSLIKEIEQTFKESDSDFLKLYKVQMYLQKKYEFDLNTKDSSSLYNLLKREKGVCLAYSYAFEKVMHELEFEAQTIVGFTEIGNNDSFHAWNVVKMEDKWGHIDVLFNNQDFLNTRDLENLKIWKEWVENADTEAIASLFFQNFGKSDNQMGFENGRIWDNDDLEIKAEGFKASVEDAETVRELVLKRIEELLN